MDRMIQNSNQIDFRGNLSTSAHGTASFSIMMPDVLTANVFGITIPPISAPITIDLLMDTSYWCFQNQYSVTYQALIEKKYTVL